MSGDVLLPRRSRGGSGGEGTRLGEGLFEESRLLRPGWRAAQVSRWIRNQVSVRLPVNTAVRIQGKVTKSEVEMKEVMAKRGGIRNQAQGCV